MWNRIASLVLILCCALPASAEYIEPGDVQIKTQKYQPTKTDFASGQYKYRIAWQGIEVADATVSVRNHADDSFTEYYDVTAQAETEGMVRLFYKMNHESSAIFDARSFRPLRFESYQKERSKEKKREVAFTSDGMIKFSTSKNGELRSKKEFRSENQTLDPISAAFFARSLPIELGTEASFDVFNGKHRYLITCKVDKLEEIEFAGRMINAYRVIPTVKKLTDSEEDKRLESAFIWISADSARHVLRVQSKVYVGSVTAELIGFTPERSAAPSRQFVQATLKQSM